MNNRTIAKITGFSLILMALTSGVSIGYIYPLVYDPLNTELSKSVLTQNSNLYDFMLIGILMTLILDFITSYTFYKFFKKDDKKMALLAGFFRAIYTIIFGVATIFLVQNANMGELENNVINNNFYYFQFIWSSGVVLFGVHLLLIGILMKKHKLIPKFLYFLTLIAGASYMLVHSLKLMPLKSNVANDLELFLAIPMILGELGLAIWLLTKGGKVSPINNNIKI